MTYGSSRAVGPKHFLSSGSWRKIPGGKECFLTCAMQQNTGEGALDQESRNVDSGPNSATDSEAGQVTSSL